MIKQIVMLVAFLAGCANGIPADVEIAPSPNEMVAHIESRDLLPVSGEMEGVIFPQWAIEQAPIAQPSGVTFPECPDADCQQVKAARNYGIEADGKGKLRWVPNDRIHHVSLTENEEINAQLLLAAQDLSADTGIEVVVDSEQPEVTFTWDHSEDPSPECLGTTAGTCWLGAAHCNDNFRTKTVHALPVEYGGYNAVICNSWTIGLDLDNIQAVQDSLIYGGHVLRTVLAHEIGHTLGLRHTYINAYNAPLMDASLSYSQMTRDITVGADQQAQLNAFDIVPE